MLPNTISSYFEKAIISGHYIFSTKDCLEIKKEADKELNKRGIKLNDVLKEDVKKSITRYMSLFRLIK